MLKFAVQGQQITGNQTLLTKKDDLEWLYDVHLRKTKPEAVKSAILIGNEDAPNQIWTSEVRTPFLTTIFTLEYLVNE